MFQKWFKNSKCIILVISFLIITILPIDVSAATVKTKETSVKLATGKSVTLKISGTSKKITWSSNKKSVATVTSAGKVKAKSKGTATITAKIKDSSKKYICKVTVTSVHQITYQAHVQSVGWQNAVTTVDVTSKTASGKTAGTTGKSKRLEALKINLTNPSGMSMVSYRPM